MVPLKGPVISEKDLDTGPVVLHLTATAEMENSVGDTETASKQEEKAPSLG